MTLFCITWFDDFFRFEQCKREFLLLFKSRGMLPCIYWCSRSRRGQVWVRVKVSPGRVKVRVRAQIFGPGLNQMTSVRTVIKRVFVCVQRVGICCICSSCIA